MTEIRIRREAVAMLPGIPAFVIVTELIGMVFHWPWDRGGAVLNLVMAIAIAPAVAVFQVVLEQRPVAVSTTVVSGILLTHAAVFGSDDRWADSLVLIAGVFACSCAIAAMRRRLESA